MMQWKNCREKITHSNFFSEHTKFIFLRYLYILLFYPLRSFKTFVKFEDTTLRLWGHRATMGALFMVKNGQWSCSYLSVRNKFTFIFWFVSECVKGLPYALVQNQCYIMEPDFYSQLYTLHLQKHKKNKRNEIIIKNQGKSGSSGKTWVIF